MDGIVRMVCRKKKQEIFWYFISLCYIITDLLYTYLPATGLDPDILIFEGQSDQLKMFSFSFMCMHCNWQRSLKSHSFVSVLERSLAFLVDFNKNHNLKVFVIQILL